MIFIRVDSNPVIASGHVMRCIPIAQTLKQQGGEVLFLTADENPVPVLRENGFDAQVLHSNWQDLETEIPAVKQILAAYEKPLLLVDTYSITAHYVEQLSAAAHVCYLGGKQEYLGPLAALFNYSTSIDRDFYQAAYGGTETKLYLGPAYAPLRAAFQNHPLRRTAAVRRVLLTTGNTDANGVTPQILERLLAEPAAEQAVFDVVVGRMFSNKPELYARYGAEPRVQLHENVHDMEQLMRQCDLAVSANGTTVYELAACGVPAITFAMVAEQLPSAQALGKLGAVAFCGTTYTGADACLAKISQAFAQYATDSNARNALAKAGHDLTDGNGCSRIAQALRPYWAE